MGTGELRKAQEGGCSPAGEQHLGPGAPRPRLHLADDLSILGDEDLHGRPLGRSAEHTHGGHLPGTKAGG